MKRRAGRGRRRSSRAERVGSLRTTPASTLRPVRLCELSPAVMATKHLGVTAPISMTAPTPRDLEVTRTLIQELRDKGVYETVEEGRTRSVQRPWLLVHPLEELVEGETPRHQLTLAAQPRALRTAGRLSSAVSTPSSSSLSTAPPSPTAFQKPKLATRELPRRSFDRNSLTRAPLPEVARSSRLDRTDWACMVLEPISIPSSSCPSTSSATSSSASLKKCFERQRASSRSSCVARLPPSLF